MVLNVTTSTLEEAGPAFNPTVSNNLNITLSILPLLPWVVPYWLFGSTFTDSNSAVKGNPTWHLVVALVNVIAPDDTVLFASTAPLFNTATVWPSRWLNPDIVVAELPE